MTVAVSAVQVVGMVVELLHDFVVLHEIEFFLACSGIADGDGRIGIVGNNGHGAAYGVNHDIAPTAFLYVFGIDYEVVLVVVQVAETLVGLAVYVHHVGIRAVGSHVRFGESFACVVIEEVVDADDTKVKGCPSAGFVEIDVICQACGCAGIDPGHFEFGLLAGIGVYVDGNEEIAVLGFLFML